jgi:hypothetical protein
MAEILGLFSQGILTTAYQTIYTVPAGETFIPKTISFCNIGSDIGSVSINFVAGGEVAAEKNYIVKDRTVVPPDTGFLNSDMFLQSGFTIQAKCNTNNLINYQVSGVKITNG